MHTVTARCGAHMRASWDETRTWPTSSYLRIGVPQTGRLPQPKHAPHHLLMINKIIIRKLVKFLQSKNLIKCFIPSVLIPLDPLLFYFFLSDFNSILIFLSKILWLINRCVAWQESICYCSQSFRYREIDCYKKNSP